MTYFAYLFQTIHILGLSHPFLSQLLGQCGQAHFTHSRSSLPQGTLDLTRDLCASSFVNHTHVNLCQHLSVNLCQFYVEKHILAKRFRGFRPCSFPVVTCETTVLQYTMARTHYRGSLFTSWRLKQGEQKLYKFQCPLWTLFTSTYSPIAES